MFWGWGIVFMVICMVAMMWMMRGHGMFGSRSQASERKTRDTPERTLDNRLARGEIDVDEYQRRRDELQRARTSDNGSARR
jgi:uncharacterized membrane protein